MMMMMMMRWCGGRDLEHMKKNNGDLEAEYFFISVSF